MCNSRYRKNSREWEHRIISNLANDTTNVADALPNDSNHCKRVYVQLIYGITTLPRAGTKEKGKGSPYSITQRSVAEPITVLGSQLEGD